MTAAIDFTPLTRPERAVLAAKLARACKRSGGEVSADLDALYMDLAGSAPVLQRPADPFAFIGAEGD